MAYHRDMRKYTREARRFRREHGPVVGWLDLARYFPAWRVTVRTRSTPLTDRKPWMTFAAIDFLEHALTPAARVFEWGSGGSTLFLLDRVGSLVTVEHDRAWMEAVRVAVGERPGDTWQSRLAVPENIRAAATDPANPVDYVSANPDWANASFHQYAQAIDEHPENSFDLVIVDGRARPSCAWHAVPKVKAGGILFLDNSERPHYQAIHAHMRELGWQKIELSGPTAYLRHFTCSTAWTKPPAR